MKTLSILLVSSLLTACAAQVPPFPKVESLFEPDTNKGVAAEYRVLSQKPFKVEFKEEKPMEVLNGQVCIPMEEFQAILIWKKSLEDWYSSVKCRKK